jgi:hypothetical protein
MINTNDLFSLFNPEIERWFSSYKLALDTDDSYIVSLTDESTISNYLSSMTFPIANSFYSNDKTKFYYCYSSSENINGSTSLFGKAAFFTASKDMAPEILDCFESYNQDNSVIVKYEVQCMASSKYYDTPENNYFPVK